MNSNATHRNSEHTATEADTRPLLTVVRFDRDDWDRPDTTAPLLVGFCGFADDEAEYAVAA